MKPKTVEECMKEFLIILSPENQLELAMSSRDDLIKYHHGLGRWIRNNWDLWSNQLDGSLFGHMKTLGFTHPDDMSQALIVEFWNRTNNQPSQLSEMAEEYRKYWSKYGKF